MSKWRALLISLLCAALSVSFIGQDLFWVFGLIAAVFFSVSAYKFALSTFYAQGRSVMSNTQTTSIPMTSQGSRRLFVPPSIDK